MKLSPQNELVAGKDHQIAAKMYALISDEVKKYQPPVPTPGSIPGSGGYGPLSELGNATTMIAVQDEAYVAKDLAEMVIPLMRTSLGSLCDRRDCSTPISFRRPSRSRKYLFWRRATIKRR